MGCPTYRLPINKTTCYLIILQRGCRDCSASPGVIVRRVDKGYCEWREIQDHPVLPLTKVGGFSEVAIKCGLDPDEFREQAVENIKGTEVQDGVLLEADLAEILADDLWNDILSAAPEMVPYKEAPP